MIQSDLFTTERKSLSTLLSHQLIFLEKYALVVSSSQKDASFKDKAIIIRFSEYEWEVFLCLLRFYPMYAPFEELLSSITCLPVQTARERLMEARNADDVLGGGAGEAWKQELRPVSRVITKLRKKLHDIHLTFTSVRGMGYLITNEEAEESHLSLAEIPFLAESRAMEGGTSQREIASS